MIEFLKGTIEVGNVRYFMFLFTGISGIVLLWLFLRHKSDTFRYRFFMGMLIFNLALHFGKLAFEPYRSQLPMSLRKITYENICAVSTLIFPFMFAARKNKTVISYFYFVGVFGGLAAHCYPTNAIGYPVLYFDTIRFYVNHWNLIAVPLVAAMTKTIEIDYKKWWTIPIIFLSIELLILLNEIVVVKMGWIESTRAQFFDPDWRNSSFVFGPATTYGDITKLLTVFVPKFLTQDVFGLNGGNMTYWPVVWMIIPAWIYLPIMYVLFGAPFLIPQMIRDYKAHVARKNGNGKTVADEDSDTECENNSVKDTKTQ